MSTVSTPINLKRALTTNRVVRNGSYVDATTQTHIAEGANSLARWMNKAVEFRCPIPNIPALSATARTRWRTVIHTSPFARHLWVRFLMATSNDGSGTAHTSKDPFGRVLIEETDGTDVGTADYHWGYSVTHNDSPNAMSSVRLPVVDTNNDIVEVSGSTDYLVTVSDEQSSRLVGVCIYEECAASDTANGYVMAGTSADAPILSADRSGPLAMLRDQWTDGSAILWPWASNLDSSAPTRISATPPCNWIDSTITGTGAVAASEPGVSLKLTNRSTVRRGDVPTKWYVHATMSAAATTGHVYLYDSVDGELADIPVTSNTAAWYSATVNLAASDRRFSIRMEGDGTNTLTLYASTLMQVE